LRRHRKPGNLKAKIGFLAFTLTIIIAALALSTPTGSQVEGQVKKAVILDTLKPNPAFIERVQACLEEAGYQVDIYQGEEVTVKFLENFPGGYRLVILRLHSALYRDEGLYFFTGEPYTTTKYVYEQLVGDVKRAYAYEGAKPVFAVSQAFIGQHLKGKFKNAVIIAMGCDTMTDPLMPTQFIRQGALAYIGWGGLVTLPHSDRAVAHLIENLYAKGLTIEEAVKDTMRQVGPDPQYHAKLNYYPPKAGKQRVI